MNKTFLFYLPCCLLGLMAASKAFADDIAMENAEDVIIHNDLISNRNDLGRTDSENNYKERFL